MGKALCSGLVVLAVLVVASTALADDRSAEEHKEAAKAYFKAGAFDKAIAEFEAAYAIASEPGLLFNLGRACEEAGQHARAVEFYQQFLVVDPSSSRRAEAQARIVALERTIDGEVEAARKAEEAAREAAEGRRREAAAQAQKAAQAEERRRRAEGYAVSAKAHQSAGRFDKAIAAWREAYGVLPLPDYLFDAAIASRQKGDLAASVAYYEGYLAAVPSGARSVEARRAVGEMRQELAVAAAESASTGWTDGRSRWGLAVRAGASLHALAERLTSDCLDYAIDDFKLLGPRPTVGASVSLAANRWIALEAGFLYSWFRLPCESPATDFSSSTIEMSTLAKITTFAPKAGLVANVYLGGAVGIFGFGSDFGGWYREPVVGTELGVRALGGEFLLDARAQRGIDHGFEPTGSDVVPQVIFVSRILLVYAYRGS